MARPLGSKNSRETAFRKRYKIRLTSPKGYRPQWILTVPEVVVHELGEQVQFVETPEGILLRSASDGG